MRLPVWAGKGETVKKIQEGRQEWVYMKFIDPVWLHRGYMDAETEKGLQLKSR